MLAAGRSDDLEAAEVRRDEEHAAAVAERGFDRLPTDRLAHPATPTPRAGGPAPAHLRSPPRPAPAETASRRPTSRRETRARGWCACGGGSVATARRAGIPRAAPSASTSRRGIAPRIRARSGGLVTRLLPFFSWRRAAPQLDFDRGAARSRRPQVVAVEIVMDGRRAGERRRFHLSAQALDHLLDRNGRDLRAPAQRVHDRVRVDPGCGL